MTTDNFTFSMADDWEAPVTAKQILEKHLASGNKEMSPVELAPYVAAYRRDNNMSVLPRITTNQRTSMRNLRRK